MYVCTPHLCAYMHACMCTVHLWGLCAHWAYCSYISMCAPTQDGYIVHIPYLIPCRLKTTSVRTLTSNLCPLPIMHSCTDTVATFGVTLKRTGLSMNFITLSLCALGTSSWHIEALLTSSLPSYAAAFCSCARLCILLILSHAEASYSWNMQEEEAGLCGSVCEIT